MKYLVVDIDGTISDAECRSIKYLRGENGKDRKEKDWDSFFNACEHDAPIKEICELISSLYWQQYGIIFCSGRRLSTLEMTKNWMRKHMSLDPDSCEFLFRKDSDFRHDVEVKPQMLAKWLEANPDAEILAIFEDRNSMVAKWRELGYKCLQVQLGDF